MPHVQPDKKFRHLVRLAQIGDHQYWVWGTFNLSVRTFAILSLFEGGEDEPMPYVVTEVETIDARSSQLTPLTEEWAEEAYREAALCMCRHYGFPPIHCARFEDEYFNVVAVGQFEHQGRQYLTLQLLEDVMREAEAPSTFIGEVKENDIVVVHPESPDFAPLSKKASASVEELYAALSADETAESTPDFN